MSKDLKPWEEEDQDTLTKIIGELVNQGFEFKKMAADGPLADIFTIQKPDEFGLGILMGAIFSEFNNYWIKKYGEEMKKEDVEFMIFQIEQVAEMIRDGLEK